MLGCQAPDLRAFLLETSILAELTPSLCQAILERLHRRNPFVVALDEAATTFRYHALFAEFLRQRLSAEWPHRIAELHCRAAQEWDTAAQEIERVGEELLRQGSLDTLQGWIRALPATVQQARPRLTYFMGVCAWQKGGDGPRPTAAGASLA